MSAAASHAPGGARRRFAGSAVLFCGAILLTAVRFVLPAGAGIEPVTFPLVERNGSGVAGTVTLESVDGVTWFGIGVTGPDTNYLPIIRIGTCEAFASDAATPLALVTLGDTVSTAIDIPIERLQAGRYVVDLHVAGGSYDELLDPETSVACGTIPASTDATVPGDGAGAGAGTSAASDESVDPRMPADGSDPIQTPDAGVGPIQSERDWLMVTGALLGLASFTLAVTGLRAERNASDNRLAYVPVRAAAVSGASPRGSLVAHRAPRIRRLTRGLTR